MKWNSYRDLEAWQTSMELVVCIYEITSGFPIEEKFGLTSQMRRSAVSIPSNVAEGTARIGRKLLLVFLSYAQGSLAELETQLLVAEKIGMLDPGQFPEEKIKACRASIYTLVYRLRRKNPQ